jgi:23S rRNA (uracil1939-C5)-methyltransferase
MPLGAEAALDAKVEHVEKLLRRSVDLVHPSPRPLGYRARVELKVDSGGRLGYFRPRSHEHVPVPECAIARPEINAVLGQLPPLQGLEVVELRSDGERIVLHAGPGRGKQHPKAIKRILRQKIGESSALADYGLSGVAVAGRPLFGDCSLQIVAGGVTHHISPGSFYQVNLEVNQLLVNRIGSGVRGSSPSAVLDLYSGAGNLSMPLAANGIAVTQVELAGSSVRDARATARRDGLQVDIREGNAGKTSAGDIFFDVAILDPPRGGAPGLLAELMVTRPRAIFYVSCEPKSLARDLRHAEGLGYRVSSLELFDMFPQTSHCETLCILERDA